MAIGTTSQTRFQVRKGLETNINATATVNTAIEGEPHYATDSKDLYIFDGTNNQLVGGLTALDAKVDVAGDTMTDQLLFSGDGRVVKKIDIALTKMKKGVVNPPGDGLISGFTTFDFDDTTLEEVYFKIQTPDDYDGTTDMELHIQYAVDTAPATAKKVRWEIEWKAIAEGEAFDFTSGTGTVGNSCDVTVGTPANDLVRIDCNLAGGANTIDPTDLLMMRFYRNPVHADDDFVGDARLVEAHVHYTANKLGTAV